MSLPMRLSDYLTEKNLTLEAFGKLIGRDASTVSRIARGVVHPEPATVRAIMTATDGAVTANDFVEEAA
jgi:transcriptional regulator with XRE-family HTH domain